MKSGLKVKKLKAGGIFGFVGRLLWNRNRVNFMYKNPPSSFKFYFNFQSLNFSTKSTTAPATGPQTDRVAALKQAFSNQFKSHFVRNSSGNFFKINRLKYII